MSQVFQGCPTTILKFSLKALLVTLNVLPVQTDNSNVNDRGQNPVLFSLSKYEFQMKSINKQSDLKNTWCV